MHILSATTIGLLISFFQSSVLWAYCIAFCLIFGWEIVEYVVFVMSGGKRMFEAVENRIIDVLLGLGMFAIAYHNTIMLHRNTTLYVLIPVIVLNILFAFIGWLHYHKINKK